MLIFKQSLRFPYALTSGFYAALIHLKRTLMHSGGSKLVDVFNDLLYLAVAALFFALSFGLIAGFERMIGGGADANNKERKA